MSAQISDLLVNYSLHSDKTPSLSWTEHVQCCSFRFACQTTWLTKVLDSIRLGDIYSALADGVYCRKCQNIKFAHKYPRHGFAEPRCHGLISNFFNVVWLKRGKYAPRAEINCLILKNNFKIYRKKACRTGITTYTKILSLAMRKTPSTNRREMVPHSAFATVQLPNSYWLHFWLHNVPSAVIFACGRVETVQYVLSNNLNMSRFLFRSPSAFRC
jgi:hypothetical protein